MSLVLVITGLLIGGILVGQDLIRAAGVRAQIAQIENYNSAVNTFKGKYNALPGDMDQITASSFGFAARGQYAGEGDGNGVIEGIYSNTASSNSGGNECMGETVMFWVDLSTASLIDGRFSAGRSTTQIAGTDLTTGAQFGAYFPNAKIGQGNYVYVWSGGNSSSVTYGNGINYYGLSSINGLWCNFDGQLISSPGLTVLQAYSIDTKMDDGLPQAGKVTAQYVNGYTGNPVPNYPTWAIGGQPVSSSTTGAHGASGAPIKSSQPIAGTSATCYDNNSGAAKLAQYSIAQNNGSGMNCALSFQFQ